MSDPIKIEKGIPMPQVPARWGSMGETLQAMEPGDSFFTPHRSRYIYYLAQKLGLRVTISACTENGIAGFRVWRVADKT